MFERNNTRFVNITNKKAHGGLPFCEILHALFLRFETCLPTPQKVLLLPELEIRHVLEADRAVCMHGRGVFRLCLEPQERFGVPFG